MILTEEEKAAALWSNLDDAALGKMVKKKIEFLTDAAAQLDRVTIFAAAMLLCCAAEEQGASEMTLQIDGLTQAGMGFGDWKIMAMKLQDAPLLDFQEGWLNGEKSVKAFGKPILGSGLLSLG